MTMRESCIYDAYYIVRCKCLSQPKQLLHLCTTSPAPSPLLLTYLLLTLSSLTLTLTRKSSAASASQSASLFPLGDSVRRRPDKGELPPG